MSQFFGLSFDPSAGSEVGDFLITEAVFSIVYYFKGSPLPHVFRSIRAVFGAYLVWKGATYSVHKTIGLFWSQVTFFIVIGLCMLAGYEVTKVLEERRGVN